MQTILLVDDERRMLDLLELFLKPIGYKCIKVQDGEEALRVLKVQQVHLVILDVMMPLMGGWQTCEEIRKLSNVPILMLTAREDKSDIVKGLNLGADDYLTKPFDDQELIARVHALLRRIPEVKPINVFTDGFELDTESYSLISNGNKVSLTLKEYKILEALMNHPTRTYTREQLLLVAWDHHSLTDIRTVDSHIRNLREKLRKAGFPTDQYIMTVWGIGYKWK